MERRRIHWNGAPGWGAELAGSGGGRSRSAASKRRAPLFTVAASAPVLMHPHPNQADLILDYNSYKS